MNSIIEDLKNHWNLLTDKYVASEAFVNTTFLTIVEKYSNINRFYHNLEHIKQMIDFVNTNNNKIQYLDDVLFAVWFHDFEYNPHKTDNEEQSAKIAKEFLKNIGYNREKYRTIYNYILRTAKHTEFKQKDTIDLRIFLDSDILIFASEKEKYFEYSQKIRKEYSYITDLRYNKGRIKILKNFIKNKYIFHLHEHRKIYDDIARENIKNEIQLLTQKL
jgi:predicted metal-dependent HD superfamily phosphohydrolase